MTTVKWIKLSVNLFDDEKIKLIRSMPDGFQLFYVWVNLLCISGKANQNGFIVLNENLPYTASMLASLTSINENIINYALDTFERFRMIERLEDAVHICNWDKHQSVDKLNQIKEDNNRRKQKQRENERLLADKSDTKKEIEDIINYLNVKANKSFKSSTPKTKTFINARLNEGFKLKDFKTVINNKCNSWLNSDMAVYLRPETLFGTKFESYLNEKTEKKADAISDIAREQAFIEHIERGGNPDEFSY